MQARGRRRAPGKAVEVFGDPDLPHAYTYTEDVADGLVALGTRAHAHGVWMLPTLPAGSTRAMVERFERALGQPIPMSRVPSWLLRAAGVAVPMLRELARGRGPRSPRSARPPERDRRAGPRARRPRATSASRAVTHSQRRRSPWRSTKHSGLKCTRPCASSV